jgi:alpha-1,3-mannosyltransferase
LLLQWFRGYGNIAVVPSVNLEYSNEAGHRIKLDKGYVSELIKSRSEQRMIKWKPPPEKVKCMPDWGLQSWVPWDDKLGKFLGD